MFGGIFLVDLVRPLLPIGVLMIGQQAPLVADDAGHLAEGADRIRGTSSFPMFSRVQNVPGAELFQPFHPSSRLSSWASRARWNEGGLHEHVETDRWWPLD